MSPQRFLAGSVAIQPLDRSVSGFDEHFLSLRLDHQKINPWFAEFWKSYFGCTIVNTSTNVRMTRVVRIASSRVRRSHFWLFAGMCWCWEASCRRARWSAPAPGPFPPFCPRRDLGRSQSSRWYAYCLLWERGARPMPQNAPRQGRRFKRAPHASTIQG